VLAQDLPRTRGVYLFRDARGLLLYVGKATNLRARVRSYFTSDERKRMSDLRAEVASVRVLHCSTDVESAALEARLIERYAPRYNRAGVRRRSPVYLRITNERHPRFAVAKQARDDGSDYIGPFSSTARARGVAGTLSGLFGIRTCTLRLNGTSHEPCALYALGSCHGPCTAREEDAGRHDEAVRAMRADLSADGLRVARGLLAAKLAGLAGQRRFEEAASHRDAFADLVRVVDRAQRLKALRAAGVVRLEADGQVIELDGGCLRADDPPLDAPDTDMALATPRLGERQAVAAWLERAEGVRVESAEQGLAYPWPRAEPLEQIDL
jgi:DNA polymerase-3 subunit epsilon